MFEALETGFGLDVVVGLHSTSNSVLDALAHILNFAGNELFFIAALALIYWVINRELGLRLFFILIAISLVSFTLKDVLARPRPYQVSDTITPLFEASGFGIPSGHVSFAAAIWGYLAYWYKKQLVTIAVVVYVLLQMWGRMYAGVHYPQDVLAGLLVGGLTLLLYILLSGPYLRFWRQRALWQQVTLGLASGVVGLILYSSQEVLMMFGLLVGGSIAAALEAEYIHFAPHEQLLRRVIQYTSGLILSIGILLGLKALFGTGETQILRVLRYSTVALVALAIWPFISIQIDLMNQRQITADAQPT